MTTNGQWVQTSAGRYVYDQGDGWIFDHLSQQWYLMESPPSIPTGAPAAATRKRLWSRLTQRPEGILMAGWDGWRDGAILGTFTMLVTWLARVAIVYSGYQIAKVWTVGSDGGWFLTRWVLGPPEVGSGPKEFAMAYTFAYVLLAAFAFLVLLMAALNPEQSAALTTAFVAHNVYRHMVEDMNGTHRKPTWQPPGGR